MATPQETEERLRTWTLSQADRERMCIGLLALDDRFTNVRPRRPKGGPDGGRDIEATLDGRHEVWGGVGFRNNANDSNQDKTWAAKKFKSDVDAALCGAIHGFVFFTNIDLSPAEISDLEDYARRQGAQFVEVFHRERLRIVLDSPKGFAYRFQYLRLPMSEPEQAAFFAQLGDRIEGLLLGRFDRIDEQLARNEFLHECHKPVRLVSGVVALDRAYAPVEMEHFRFMCVVTNLGGGDPPPSLYIAGRDAYVRRVRGGLSMPAFGEQALVWSQSPDEQIQSTMVGIHDRQSELVSSSPMFGKEPFKKLADFDERTMMLWMTEPLLEKVQSVALVVNDYVLFACEKERLRSKPAPMGSPWQWPNPLTDEEQRVPWVSVGIETDLPVMGEPNRMQVHTMWSLAFASYTPRRTGYCEYCLDPSTRKR
jgi:hypothetical protein